MPDGDKVHEKLGWRYQNAYKQICDGQFGGGELAKEVVSAVQKDIQDGGDRLLQLLREFADIAQQIIDKRRMFEPIDWQKEFRRVDGLVQPIYANRRLKTLAGEACKEQLQSLRSGRNPSNCYIELITIYARNVYVAQFTEKVPLSPSHHKKVSREFVNERLQVIRPYIEHRLLEYAQHVYRQNTVWVKWPCDRSGKKPHYNIDTDISTIGV